MVLVVILLLARVAEMQIFDFTLSNYVFGVLDGCQPIESCPKGFCRDSSATRVMSTYSCVNIL
jgi:hypothetical protein